MYESDLEKYFWANEKQYMSKFPHQLNVYDKFFNHYRGTDVVVMEVGINHGGSLEMWRDYFGPAAKIVGIDIVDCSSLKKVVDADILCGNQVDRNFWKEVRAKYPRVDIFIDDGGHQMDEQIVTFEEMFLHVDRHGFYVCEDLHTSYRPAFGGGYKKPGTFIEFTKTLTDQLNAYNSEDVALYPNDFTQHAYGIHLYPSLLLVEKRPYNEYGGATTTGKLLRD